MKIIRIDTINLREFPAVTWVQVHTDAGIVGLGETWFGPRAVSGAVHELFSPLLIGKDPLAIERLWRDMFDMANAFGYAGAEMRAISAIDTALWDIAGQVAKQPIYNLLGGACRDRIRVYNTCAQYGANKDMELAMLDAGTLAKSLLDDGITILKWAFTDPFALPSRGIYLSDQDLELMQEPMRQIRKAVGNQMQIANDGHGHWNLQNAIRIGRAMDQYTMFWQEELIQPTNVENHLALAREVQAPVCVSERLVSKYQFREYLRTGAAEVVMPDLIWTGGITETKKIATMAEAEQAPVAPHDCSGPVNVFACAHICMNAPNAMVMETVRAFYGKGGFYDRLIEPNIVVKDGFLLAPEGPGLGTRLRPEVRERSDATVESSDTPGGYHWGGLDNMFEVVDRPDGGRRLRRKRRG
jgi:L-alanine-DL-glutamate epimerase-like enolase superfamily enzyme